MDITTVSAPAPGTADPGDLYIDSASRQLWLGVDPSVDPAAAVLISDIVALQAADTSTLNNAKAYTDTQIATRAPTVHTHSSSQITDFTGAVQGVVNAMPTVAWVRGMIVTWSGLLSAIGVGPLAGWSLCDGSNGTPDLRDRFIIGAGNKVPGDKNTQTSFLTDTQGSHVHTINGVALTLAQLPSHNHYNNGLRGQGNFNTGDQSQSHTHAGDISGRALVSYAGGAGGQGTSGGGFTTAANTNWADRGHYHNVSIDLYSYGYSDAAGSGGAHTHTETTAGSHQHTVTAQQLRDTTPFYALAYIMRIV